MGSGGAGGVLSPKSPSKSSYVNNRVADSGNINDEKQSNKQQNASSRKVTKSKTVEMQQQPQRRSTESKG